MTHKAKPALDNPDRTRCDDERVFASPVARAVVRTIVECRGVTKAQARQIYLDYINPTPPGHEHPPCSVE